MLTTHEAIALVKEQYAIQALRFILDMCDNDHQATYDVIKALNEKIEQAKGRNETA